jgi:anthranilate synthase component 2
MRYHSLVVDKEKLSPELECVAHSLDDQEIMALKHRYYPVFGLQFHPESIGTPTGKQMLKNFLTEIEGKKKNEEFFTPVS